MSTNDVAEGCFRRGGLLKSDVTFKGGHRKVTLGDKGGGGSQKSQNKGDVLYGRSPRELHI